ncbi:uncharacterized protein LOC134723660 [Mytilus trossulus]|uniref:uncharacterized protein LOC134723660 n=1 Tax=Mytilus trossulus TaxID=6551 RepID=UPI0030040459
MDYFHVWLFTFLTLKSIDGFISIKGYGTLELNSQFELGCQIVSFQGQASWSNTNIGSITCMSDGSCTTLVKDNFNFSGNSSGIFVIINPLLEKDDQMEWTCIHDNMTTSYTVEIRSANPTEQTKSGGLKFGDIIGIIIGCVTYLALGAVLCYCGIKKKYGFSDNKVATKYVKNEH